jgi:hypothetical protein
VPNQGACTAVGDQHDAGRRIADGRVKVSDPVVAVWCECFILRYAAIFGMRGLPEGLPMPRTGIVKAGKYQYLRRHFPILAETNLWNRMSVLSPLHRVTSA